MTTIGEQLERARTSWGENGEAGLDTGLRYGDGEPIVVHVRKRGRRYDLDDAGRAVGKAGVTARGWLEVVEGVVAVEGMNVNRRGVLFVGAVEGRDLAALARKLGESALAVYAALLEADG